MLCATTPKPRFWPRVSAGAAEICRNTLRVPFLAERALVYLAHERNLLDETSLRSLVERLGLDLPFLARRLADNGKVLQTPYCLRRTT